jgi:hypothetical protein
LWRGSVDVVVVVVEEVAKLVLVVDDIDDVEVVVGRVVEVGGAVMVVVVVVAGIGDGVASLSNAPMSGAAPFHGRSTPIPSAHVHDRSSVMLLVVMLTMTGLPVGQVAF